MYFYSFESSPGKHIFIINVNRLDTVSKSASKSYMLKTVHNVLKGVNKVYAQIHCSRV